MPASLEHWRSEPGGARWLDSLPDLVEGLAEDWGLELEGAADTPHSLVVYAGEVVLKLNAPSHFEADHEADALAHWAGEGAVRLLARDDERRALLVERCRPGTELRDTDADPIAVVGPLLPRLWRAPSPGHRFRLLRDEAARWAEEVPRRYEASGSPFERELLDYAVEVFRSASEEQREGVVVNQDLHGGNVLRAEREPWLVVDPKPLVGERELDGVGLLRNAVVDAQSPERAARRWLDALAALGLDRERLRQWAVAHALAWGWDESGWSRRNVEVARAVRTA